MLEEIYIYIILNFNAGKAAGTSSFGSLSIRVSVDPASGTSGTSYGQAVIPNKGWKTVTLTETNCTYAYVNTSKVTAGNTRNIGTAVSVVGESQFTITARQHGGVGGYAVFKLDV